MKKLLIKKKCKCGTSIMCAKVEHGNTPQPVCGTCKKFGLEFARKQFLNNNRKYNKTKFN